MSEQRLLVMPKLGLTMAEGTVAKWEKREGQHFNAGDVIVVIESDKTALDVEAPAAGTLGQQLIKENEVVPVGTLLAHWQLDGEVSIVDRARREDLAPAPAQAATVEHSDTNMPPAKASGGRQLATPLARRLAREGGISLSGITGSGPRGRIQAADVKSGLAAQRAIVESAIHSGPMPAMADGTVRAPSGVERTMAGRVSAAKRDIPHFYLAIDLDVGPVMAMRAELNRVQDRQKVTMTHLLIAALARGLLTVPRMNTVWTETGLLTYDTVDIGIAVDTERGLMSPVVRDLGHDSFSSLVRKVDDVVARARQGALRAEDQKGSAITISNAGMHNVRYMTSIIVPGQAAILGVGAVQDCFRPDEAGAPKLRREMGVVLSADHRVHTGVGALAFLQAFENALLHPLQLLTGQ
jgi:pyruvate dehydrogenase E2 component (dihydrolipoamide acetyltransferase)